MKHIIIVLKQPRIDVKKSNQIKTKQKPSFIEKIINTRKFLICSNVDILENLNTLGKRECLLQCLCYDTMLFNDIKM
jgi:spore coat protein CotF